MAGSRALGPIRRRKLSDEVQARLGEAIRSGEYPPGAYLPSERELMALFDVGRPSVREALYALARQGFVRIAAGERARVVQPTAGHMLGELDGVARQLLAQPGGIRHFEQARLFLELAVVRHACEAATPEGLARLRDALAANEAAIGHAEWFAATDVAFHRALADLVGNPVILALQDAAAEWLITQRPSLADTGTHNRMSYAGHLAILRAVEARDCAAAQDAMRRHLDEAYNRYARN